MAAIQVRAAQTISGGYTVRFPKAREQNKMPSESFFETWGKNIEDLIERHPLQIISWEATRRCNLNCVHCGSPAENAVIKEELTTGEVINAFNQIAKDFDMSEFKHINITGGEPTVREDLLTILKELSKKPFYRNVDIQTNGVIIAHNPKILEEFKKYGVTGIGISIDGLRETNDKFRKKKGHFDEAFKAAKLAVEKGFEVTVSTVAHSKNVNEIPKLYELIKREIHPRIFRIMTIDSIGRTKTNREYLLSPEQTREVINFLFKEYVENCENYKNSKETMIELGCGGWLGCELEGLIRPYVFHCIAGVNNLGILHDGKLAACSNIPREEGFMEGDLRTERIKEVWENRYQRYRGFEWKKVGECKNCSEWRYCHGGPIHKRLRDGKMLDCLYQTYFHKKDYRNN